VAVPTVSSARSTTLAATPTGGVLLPMMRPMHETATWTAA
jgi:hypothetical protein